FYGTSQLSLLPVNEQRRSWSAGWIDSIGQHPLWDDNFWWWWRRRHGVRSQYRWLRLYDPPWFRLGCRIDLIGQHPVWNDRVRWQFGPGLGVRPQHRWHGFHDPA